MIKFCMLSWRRSKCPVIKCCLSDSVHRTVTCRLPEVFGVRALRKLYRRQHTAAALGRVFQRKLSSEQAMTAVVPDPVTDHRQTRFTEQQAAEVLEEIKGAGQESNSLHKAFSIFSKALQRIPARLVTAEEATLLVQGLGLTAEKPLRFEPPKPPVIIGSQALHCALGNQHVVDVSLPLPNACFDQKDQLDDRYIQRRAVYLAILAEALQQHTCISKLQWEFLRENIRKPVIVLIVTAHESNIRLRLVPCLDSNAFPPAKLAPTRSNLRAPPASAPTHATPDASAASPNYNNEILWDMHPCSNLQAVQKTLEQLPALRDALLLLKAWAQQQGLASACDGLSGWLLTCFAGRVATCGALVAGMTALQMLRAMLLRLSQASPFLGGQAIAVPANDSSGTAISSPEAPKSAFQTVFLDASGHVNLAANISASRAKQVQEAAKQTVLLLNNMVAPDSAFDAALLSKLPAPASYDCWWNVTVPSLPSESQSNPARLRTDLPPWRELELKIHRIATRALGIRATNVYVLPRPLKPASALDAASIQPESQTILVAAQIDTQHAGSLLDTGPVPSTPEAAAFRAFWGDSDKGGMAEQRRFQDGRTLEAVLWQPVVPASQRHLILDHILTYAINRHLGQEGLRVSGSAGLLDTAITAQSYPFADQAASVRQLQDAFGLLGKQLRSLSLALTITGVQPISASMRRCAVFPPVPHPLAGASATSTKHMARCIEPVEALVQLEGSGRWPKHPEAYRKTKAAMGLQMAEDLASGFGLRSSATDDFVDVFAGGFAFRLYLHSARDEGIAREQAAALKHQPAASLSSQHAQLPTSLTTSRDHASLMKSLTHHAMMAAAVDAYNALAATVRVFKRWLGAQLFSNHVCDEAAELIVAAAFIGPSSMPIPGSVVAGFMRVLQLVSQHPWRLRPLIVDPAHELSTEQAAAAHLQYDLARKEQRAPAMALCTPHDLAASHWSSHGRPSAAIVSRLVALSARSLATLQDHLFRGNSDGQHVFASIFTTPVLDFNMLMSLRPEAVPGSEHALPTSAAAQLLPSRGKRTRPDYEAEATEGDQKKLSQANLTRIPASVLAKHGFERAAKELLVGFDPVSHFVHLLEHHVGHFGTVCADFHAGCLLAIRWAPKAFQPGLLQVEAAQCTAPLQPPQAEKQTLRKKQKPSVTAAPMVDGDVVSWTGQTIVDIQSVLADIALLGAGLVETISPLEK